MTSKYLKALFANLIVLASAGLLMRLMPIYTVPHFNFEHVRHAHSHLAFLGWVFGAYYLTLVQLFLPRNATMEKAKYRQLFWLIQLCVAGMFMAFLLFGYTAPAIGFLTFHTILAYLFFWYLFKDVGMPNGGKERSPTAAFLKSAIFCFVLSSLAPFLIPAAKIFGGGNPGYMKLLIAFYLHFHYNGWFIFGMFALLYKVLDNNGIPYNRNLATKQLQLMWIALLPVYFISVPQLAPPQWVQLVVFASTIMGCLAIGLFLHQLSDVCCMVRSKFGKSGVQLLLMAATALFAKELCQVFGAVPENLGLKLHLNHFLLIGYLHLLFLGCITPFILFLFSALGWLKLSGSKITKAGLYLYFSGVFVSEAYLFAMGFQLMPNFHSILPAPPTMLFASSILTFFGFFAIAGTSIALPNTKPNKET